MKSSDKHLNLLEFAIHKLGVKDGGYTILNQCKDINELPSRGESGYGLCRNGNGWLVYRYDRNSRDAFSLHSSIYDAARDIYYRLSGMTSCTESGIYVFRKEWERATGLELDLIDD